MPSPVYHSLGEGTCVQQKQTVGYIFCRNALIKNKIFLIYHEIQKGSVYGDHIQGADDKLGQFLSQDIKATAYHRNCLRHSLERCPSLV